MTCYLPQVEGQLKYAGGETRTYTLSSPYELDFIAQHTSVHPAEVIGAFGKKTDLRNVSSSAEAGNGMLHADVVRLKGADGVIESLRIVPLKRQAGVILFGLTLGNPS